MSSIGGALPLISLPSAVTSGTAAIASGNQMLNQDAEQIANLNNQDLLHPLMNLSQSNLLAEAGADVIRASNNVLGTLLDSFA
jgi:predicted PurR-regulated permease PerM